MTDYTKWKRIDLEPPGTPSLSDTDPESRKKAEKETNNDLRKPIQQLMCDAHEEILNENPTPESLNHAIKRMVSMLGKAALASEHSSKKLVYLTYAIASLTFVIFILELVSCNSSNTKIISITKS